MVGSGVGDGLSFRVLRSCPQTWGRLGELATPHGVVPTPCFMPVASQASVKAIAPDDLHSIGVDMLLANTYHLYLRPGAEVVQQLGGLHRFMAWPRPILTDSGGYQVFSLAPLRQVDDNGVLFRSHIDGSQHLFTPERAVELQEALGADIIMVLDECAPYGADKLHVERATRRSQLWAERCLRSRRRQDQALYGIVQGGTFPDLRRWSATAITGLDFDGYAIGGLSLGETREVMHSMIEVVMPLLPQAKSRYLMGVGSPEELLEGVARGIDLFDCALPTRVARNGALFTRRGRTNITNARFKRLDAPLETGCDCYTCGHFSAAYLHHLFRCQELLAYRLATIHNLRFIVRLMQETRDSLGRDQFPSFKESFVSEYRSTDEEVRLANKRRWLNSRGQPSI